MSARYIVRLDDACPTMDHCRWRAVEAVLDAARVKPVVAVVPDNCDPELVRSSADPGFWERVRGWEARGWTIAMHGLHHLYHRVDRKRLILPFYDRSEVAGLDLAAQTALFTRSWAAFETRGVRPTAWIAPSHAFDRTTLKALAAATPIRIVSDGLSTMPFTADGFHWVPQQLWGFTPRRRGVWTVCLHPNTMTDVDIDRLAATLAEPFYRARMTSVADLPPRPPRRSPRDHAYRGYFMLRHHATPVLLPPYRAVRALWRRAKG